MTAMRVRRSVWVAVVAFGVAMNRARAAPMLRTAETTDEYVYDGETTFCWGVNANVATSNVADAHIFQHGRGSECPLQLRVATTTGASKFAVGSSIGFTWTVAKDATDVAMFDISKTPFMIDSNSRRRATVIHSNLHACRYGSGCGPFSLGDAPIKATQNQIGNITELATVFTSSEVSFAEPGMYTVLAHIVIPSPSVESRYDFAVFTTVEVVAFIDSEVNGVASRSPDDANTSSSPDHALSTSQVIIIGVVGALIVGLAAMVAVYSVLSRRRRAKEDQVESVKPSPHSSNVRTRSSDWTELYALDDGLAANILSDDSNAIAILRSSRASSPAVSPTRERSIADFRHEIARWDMRSSASPITPSSSAILMTAAQDADRIASTPAHDCFVPLESLMLDSPPPMIKPEPTFRWTRHFRGARPSHAQPKLSRSYSPDDSGDEQEVEI